MGQSPRPPRYQVADVESTVATITGRAPDSWRRVDEGAYSWTCRWVVGWADGRTAFVKVGQPEHSGIDVEHLVYRDLADRILPRFLGFSHADGARPAVLVTEDLSAARWGTPLDLADAEALSTALYRLDEMPPPPGLEPLEPEPNWAELSQRISDLMDTGLFDVLWLDRYLEVLTANAATVAIEGDQLVHHDLFVQNWCRAARGAVLVDWAAAGIGNPELSRAWAEAGVRAAGGPSSVVMPSPQPGWAAWIAGLFAHYLSVRTWAKPARLVETQQREAHAALAWATEELDIPMPLVRGDFDPGPWRP
jgi:thiamine kinase-like enzyme